MTNSAELISLDDYAARKTPRSSGPRTKPPKRPWVKPKPVCPKDKPIETSCFAEDTLVETPQGIRAVSELFVGDELLNRAGDSVAIRWIGQARIDATDPVNTVACEMVSVPKGYFDSGLPQMDLMLPAGQILLLPGQQGDTIPTTAMILANCETPGSDDIRALRCREFRPIHIYTQKDEFIKANGVWVQVSGRAPDPRIALSVRQRAEISKLYPGFVG